MADSAFLYEEIKRKVRKLKKLEIKIRFNTNAADYVTTDLVWDNFFDLHEECTGKAKYSINKLASLNKDEYKQIISEFFFNVYYRYYKDNGIVDVQIYDPEILSHFGLPPDADYSVIKKKFRELALKYHPDTGGNAAEFIELMDNYKRLIED